ncbi:hypothetical protein [Burkholderia phage FLC9]|nr:hypothetical protein [Burkholderia phage FLC9]
MSHEHQEVDPAEATLDPLALLKHRLGKQQAALHNLLHLTENLVGAVMADISYSLSVIEAIEAHLPAEKRAAAQAGVPARSAPTVANAASTPGNHVNPTNLPPKRLSPIQQAAESAQAAMSDTLAALKSHETGVPAGRPQAPISASGAHRKPTVEGSAAAGPTPVAAATPANEVDYFGHFFGTGSIFAKFLSPTVFTTGRGFVAPEYAGLKQYTQDVTTLSPRDLEVNQWPNGFYRDETSRLGQLFLRNSKAQVIVTNLPHGDGPIYVSFAPFEQRVDIRTLSQDQLAMVWGMAHAQFLAFVRAAGDTPA